MLLAPIPTPRMASLIAIGAAFSHSHADLVARERAVVSAGRTTITPAELLSGFQFDRYSRALAIPLFGAGLLTPSAKQEVSAMRDAAKGVGELLRIASYDNTTQIPVDTDLAGFDAYTKPLFAKFDKAFEDLGVKIMEADFGPGSAK